MKTDIEKQRLIATGQSFASLSLQYEEGSLAKWGAELMSRYLLEEAFKSDPRP